VRLGTQSRVFVVGNSKNTVSMKKSCIADAAARDAGRVKKQVRFNDELFEQAPSCHVCERDLVEVVRRVFEAVGALECIVRRQTWEGLDSERCVAAAVFKVVDARLGLLPWRMGEAICDVLREQVVQLRGWLSRTVGDPLRTGIWYALCFWHGVREAL
jgi:hypothetical protein